MEKAAAGLLVRERREQVAAKKGTLIHPVILGTAAPGPTEQKTDLRVTVSPPALVLLPVLDLITPKLTQRPKRSLRTACPGCAYPFL